MGQLEHMEEELDELREKQEALVAYLGVELKIESRTLEETRDLIRKGTHAKIHYWKATIKDKS